MPKEKQIASLELSQKLKELGYPQESLFYWFPVYSHETKDITETWKLIIKGQEIMGSEVISAPTVAELWEKLPQNMYYTLWVNKKIRFVGSGSMSSGLEMFDNIKYGEFEADTEADARAKMLIYLLENKLIEL